MIQEFSIENTLSIKTRQTISFEAADDTDDLHCINVGGKKLLKLAAIYGANASGKSNVIKAFDFYMDFILNSFTKLKPRELIPFTPFKFDEGIANAPGSFEIVFYIDPYWFTYKIQLDAHYIHYEGLFFEKNGHSNHLFIRQVENVTDNKANYVWVWSADFPKDIQDMIQKSTRANATFLSTAAQFNNEHLESIHWHLEELISVLNDSYFGYTTGLLVNINKNNLQTQDIIDMLKKASIENVDNIVVDYKNDLDYEILFSHKYEKNYLLPYLSESKGTRQIFELIGPLWDSINSEKNLFIDEIEASLHNDLLEFFITTFLNNSEKSQLLFTTHNQDLLDSDLLVDDEVWFVQKDKTGGSELYSLIEFQDIPPNVSRRGLYKAGTFGAKPFITDYFKD
jgi:AAA15 family ATPase/GTPase